MRFPLGAWAWAWAPPGLGLGLGLPGPGLCGAVSPASLAEGVGGAQAAGSSVSWVGLSILRPSGIDVGDIRAAASAAGVASAPLSRPLPHR